MKQRARTGGTADFRRVVGRFYLDTSTVINAIEGHRCTRKIVPKIKRRTVLSEFMKIEFVSTLRRKPEFRKREVEMWEGYCNFSRGAMSLPVKKAVEELFEHLGRKVRVLRRACNCKISAQDAAHIGVCGLEGIENIVSDDKDITGRSRIGRPRIVVVKEVLKHRPLPEKIFWKLRRGFLFKCPVAAFKTIRDGPKGATRIA